MLFRSRVQAVTILAAAALVAYVWRRGLSLPIRAATLAAATLAALPVALFYDLMLAAIATAWLLRADGRCRLAEWEKIVLAGLFLLTLNPRSFSEILHLPIGSIVTLGFVAFVVAHIVREKTLVARATNLGLLRQDRHLPGAPTAGD